MSKEEQPDDDIIITTKKARKHVIIDDDDEEDSGLKEITTTSLKRKEPTTKFSNRVSILRTMIDTEIITRMYSLVYEVFPKLEMAVEYRNYVKASTIPIFARDIFNSKFEGPKTFIPTGYGKIFDSISRTYKDYATRKYLPGYYEVVEDNRPCNIFLDLEYDYEPNPGIDPLQTLLKFVRDFQTFLAEVGILTNGRKIKTLVLFSYSNVKASFHLHLNGDNWIFENMYHVGALVRNFVIWTQDKYGRNTDKHPYFFKQTGKLQPKFFADLAIYTMNRVFRLAYCSKSCGTNNRKPLLTSDEWKSISYDSSRAYLIKPDIDTFLASVPCYTKPGVVYNVFQCLNPDDSQPQSSSYLSFWTNGNGYMGSSANRFTRMNDCQESISEICKEIVAKHIQNEASVYFLSHDTTAQVVVIGTCSKKCPIKYQYEGVEYHKGNHVYYCVHYMANYILCRCKDETCARRPPIKYEISSDWLVPIMDSLPPGMAKVDDTVFLENMDKMMVLLKSKLNLN